MRPDAAPLVLNTDAWRAHVHQGKVHAIRKRGVLVDGVATLMPVDPEGDTVAVVGLEVPATVPVVFGGDETSVVALGQSRKAPRVGAAELLEVGALAWAPREVSEAAWSVGRLVELGLWQDCHFGILPTTWYEYGQGFSIQRGRVLYVSVSPAFTGPAAVAQARAAGIPLDWLADWVRAKLDEAATHSEARDLLAVTPPQLEILQRILEGETDEEDELLVRLDALTAAVERLTSTMSGTCLHMHSDCTSKTKAPASGATTRAKG